MPADGSFVQDVTTDTFDAAVLARSHEVPVVVDFWAPWCGPCRQLGPLLETLAAEGGGTFILAKVDTDAEPELARRYNIRSIPAVKAFRDGVLFNEFVGAQGRPFLEAFLKGLAPTQAERLAAQGAEALKRGALEDATDFYRRALAEGNSDTRILLGLAEALLEGGNLPEAAETAAEIRQGEDGYDEAQALLGIVHLHQRVEARGGPAAAYAALAAHPDEADTLFDAAAAHWVEGDPRACLEGLLEVVRRHRRWADEAGRKAMLHVFQRIGIRSPLADEMRGKLARALY